MDIADIDTPKTVQDSDVSHLEKAATDVTQHMDGSDYHTLLPKPSNDPNDPLVRHNHR